MGIGSGRHYWILGGFLGIVLTLIAAYSGILIAIICWSRQALIQALRTYMCWWGCILSGSATAGHFRLLTPLDWPNYHHRSANYHCLHCGCQNGVKCGPGPQAWSTVYPFAGLQVCILPVSRNTAPALNIGLYCMKKDRIDSCDMITGILEGNANDRANYNMTWMINAAAIIEINCRPRRPHRPPK